MGDWRKKHHGNIWFLERVNLSCDRLVFIFLVGRLYRRLLLFDSSSTISVPPPLAPPGAHALSSSMSLPR
jgi:hypothetical protein